MAKSKSGDYDEKTELTEAAPMQLLSADPSTLKVASSVLSKWLGGWMTTLPPFLEMIIEAGAKLVLDAAQQHQAAGGGTAVAAVSEPVAEDQAKS